MFGFLPSLATARTCDLPAEINKRFDCNANHSYLQSQLIFHNYLFCPSPLSFATCPGESGYKRLQTKLAHSPHLLTSQALSTIPQPASSPFMTKSIHAPARHKSGTRIVKIAVVTALLALSALALYIAISAAGDFWPRPKPTHDSALRIAVLGDSNSHSYQDRILLPQPNLRGGSYRLQTWQWTEVLAQLRGANLDQGEMGVWGTRIKIAEILDHLGAGGRAPRKRDFRFNFAVSGAECEDLTTGYYRQAPRLLSVMRRDPDQWRSALVLIRIGVNSIGQPPVLEQYAKAGLTPSAQQKIDACVSAVRDAVNLIRRDFPQTKFVLTGLLNGMNEPGAIHRWHTKEEADRIIAAVDRFDTGLREIGRGDPRFAFFDEQQWMKKQWGGRDADGKPAYRDVTLGNGLTISLTIGDAPDHAVLADEHAGTAWNALWARELIVLLNNHFAAGIPELRDEEVSALVGRALK
jgi:hypothetical protein